MIQRAAACTPIGILHPADEMIHTARAYRVRLIMLHRNRVETVVIRVTLYSLEPAELDRRAGDGSPRECRVEATGVDLGRRVHTLLLLLF